MDLGLAGAHVRAPRQCVKQFLSSLFLPKALSICSPLAKESRIKLFFDIQCYGGKEGNLGRLLSLELFAPVAGSLGSGGEYGQSAPRGYSAFSAPPMPAPAASKPPASGAPAQGQLAASQGPYHAQQGYQSAAPGFQVTACVCLRDPKGRCALALLHVQQSYLPAAQGAQVAAVCLSGVWYRSTSTTANPRFLPSLPLVCACRMMLGNNNTMLSQGTCSC